jgi:hypothetical protein
MPLMDKNKEELFCILVALPNDRSFKDLQQYRPYEISDGQGTDFTNTFMLLTPRNSSQASGTPDIIRNALQPTSARSEPSSRISPAVSPISPVASTMPQPLGEGNLRPFERVESRQRARAEESSTASFMDVELPVDSHLRSPSTGPSNILNAAELSRKRGSPSINGNESPHKRHKNSPVPVTRLRHLDPTSPGAGNTWKFRQARKSAAPAPRGASYADHLAAVQSDLTDKQRRQIRLIWTVVLEEDGECEYVHCLEKCDSFEELLNLFREDSEYDQKSATIIQNAHLWRLVYQIPDEPKKSFNIRIGNEAAFERFQAALAQSKAWSDDPDTIVDVHMRALN